MAYTVPTRKRKLLAWLRRTFPCRYRVVVRTVPLKEHGHAMFNGKQFNIRIKKPSSWAVWADTAMHEWAHVRSWHSYDTEEHGEVWGAEHRKIIAAWGDWDWKLTNTEDE